jgi:hypothetical protein
MIARAAAEYLEGKIDEDMRCNALKGMAQNVRSALKGHEG